MKFISEAKFDKNDRLKVAKNTFPLSSQQWMSKANKSYVTEGVKNRWEATQIGQLDARLSINFLFSHDNFSCSGYYLRFDGRSYCKINLINSSRDVIKSFDCYLAWEALD